MKSRVLLLVLAVMAAPSLRRWHLRWGATDAEVRRPMPGDELLPEAVVSTRAITIDAPPFEVWPWLIQMGQDRAGFYSYDWLERMLGAGIHNADRIVPEWQHLAPGELVRIFRYIRRFEPLGLTVERVDHEEALLLRTVNGAWVWSIGVAPEGERTRLILRTRARRRGGIGEAVAALALEPMHFVMEVGVLRGIRSRAGRR